MQPITSANLAAHHADQSARIAAGKLSAASLHAPGKKPVRGSAIRAAMINTILDIGEGCTLDDLRSRFTDAEIDTHHPAAFAEAKRRARLN